MECFCFPNVGVKASIERDRCIVTGIEIENKNEIDDKNFSTLSKASLNQYFLKSLWKLIICALCFAILGPHCRRIPGLCPNFQRLLEKIRV